jgi:exopolysaccharide production protein ExoF
MRYRLMRVQSAVIRQMAQRQWLVLLAIGCLVILKAPVIADEYDPILAVGDKVKLIVLETPQEEGIEEATDTLFVERVELTGEYVVQEGGTIDVPILGRMRAAEQNIETVKQSLHEKYKEVFGHRARVSLTLVSREPVYVVGPITRPGAYDYSPNLTVLHIIAKAGGPNAPSSTNWEHLEVIRERYKLQVSLSRQQKLLAQIAVLEAEAANQVPDVSSQLRLLAGDSAEALIAEARALRATIIEARNVRLQSLEAALASSNRLLQNKDERIRYMAANVEGRQERVAALEGLRTKGSVVNFNYGQARSDWSDANDRLQEALGTRAQVEERSSQLQMEHKQILIESRIELERELTAARDKLMEEERAGASSAQIANLAPDVLRLSDVSSVQLRYSIQRKANGAVTTYEASETSPLRPGDLLIVKKDGTRDDAHPGRISNPVVGQSELN